MFVEGNCSVKPWARPPAGLSSMPTEQLTNRLPSTSIGTGAESGDETRGVGTIWSTLSPQPSSGVASYPSCGEGIVRICGPAVAAVPGNGRQAAGHPPPARLDRCLKEYLKTAGIDADPTKSLCSARPWSINSSSPPGPLRQPHGIHPQAAPQGCWPSLRPSVLIASASWLSPTCFPRTERLLLAEQEGAVTAPFSWTATVVDHTVGDKRVVARGLPHLNVPLTDTA